MFDLRPIPDLGKIQSHSGRFAPFPSGASKEGEPIVRAFVIQPSPSSPNDRWRQEASLQVAFRAVPRGLTQIAKRVKDLALLPTADCFQAAVYLTARPLPPFPPGTLLNLAARVYSDTGQVGILKGLLNRPIGISFPVGRLKAQLAANRGAVLSFSLAFQPANSEIATTTLAMERQTRDSQNNLLPYPYYRHAFFVSQNFSAPAALGQWQDLLSSRSAPGLSLRALNPFSQPRNCLEYDSHLVHSPIAASSEDLPSFSTPRGNIETVVFPGSNRPSLIQARASLVANFPQLGE